MGEQRAAAWAVGPVDEHLRRRGLDDGDLAAADLGAFTQRMQDALEPGEQAVRVQPLRCHVELAIVVGTEVDDRSDEPFRLGAGEAGVERVVPLHGRSDRLALGQIEVVAHPDLLAVADDRRAGHAQLEAVGQLDASPVAGSIGASRRRIPRP